MPSVRYYDYGVMRRESERRMYDAQRRSLQPEPPFRRVKPDNGIQARAAYESVPIRTQDAPVCQNTEEISEHADGCDCTADTEVPQCGSASGMHAVSRRAPAGFGGEEVLIAVLLLLAISEGSELPLVLTLIYLLL